MPENCHSGPPEGIGSGSLRAFPVLEAIIEGETSGFLPSPNPAGRGPQQSVSRTLSLLQKGRLVLGQT